MFLKEDEEGLKRLLETDNVDVNARDNAGWTPLVRINIKVYFIP